MSESKNGSDDYVEINDQITIPKKSLIQCKFRNCIVIQFCYVES